MRVGIVSLLVVFVSGCGLLNPYKSTGWRFEVLCPPLVASPGVVSESGNALGVSSIGSVPIAGPARPLAAAALPGPCDVPPMSPAAGPVLAARDPCNLDELCRRMAAVEQRMNAPQQLPKPMPMGPATP